MDAVRLHFDFSVPEATTLKALIDVALYALREKRNRLHAMEPSWTIGPDDLRLLREATERQMDEAEALIKQLLIHPSAPTFNPPKDVH